MQRSKIVFIKIRFIAISVIFETFKHRLCWWKNLLSCGPTEKGLVVSIVVSVFVGIGASKVVIMVGKDKPFRKARLCWRKNLLSCGPTEKGQVVSLVASIVVNIAASTVVIVAGKDKSLWKALKRLWLLHSTRTFPVREEFLF